MHAKVIFLVAFASFRINDLFPYCLINTVRVMKNREEREKTQFRVIKKFISFSSLVVVVIIA